MHLFKCISAWECITPPSCWLFFYNRTLEVFYSLCNAWRMIHVHVGGCAKLPPTPNCLYSASQHRWRFFLHIMHEEDLEACEALQNLQYKWNISVFSTKHQFWNVIFYILFYKMIEHLSLEGCRPKGFIPFPCCDPKSYKSCCCFFYIIH